MPGYTCFGKPREGLKSKGGEEGVGFLVSGPFLHDLTIVKRLNIMKLYG